MKITNATRRKVFKWAGLAGFAGFGGVMDPMFYFFFVFFIFFLCASENITPDVEDEMYQQNSLKAHSVTAGIGLVFCMIMMNFMSRVTDLQMIRTVFAIGSAIVWSSPYIALYYYEKKR